MSVLSENYKKIMAEIEEKITNPEEKEFVKSKMLEMSDLFVNAIDELSARTDEKIKQIENKMAQLEDAVDEIEGDIYEDDEHIDFEIVCPYCNHEFVAEIDGRDEIICPDCNNTIELDWNDEDSCGGHCSGCHGCGAESEEDEDM